MRQTIGLMAACAALLASCTNEEMNEGLGIDTPIQVTASVEGALTTRTDNSTESLSTFGLSIKDGTGYTGNYAGENILAEKDNGTWTLSKTVLYQGSGQTYFAYAPYKEGHTGETLTFTIDADQATNDLQGSDLLYAAPAEVTDATIPVTFSHKLSKLTVTLTPEGFGTDEVSFTGVTLRGTLPTTTLNLTDGTVDTATGTATDITMCPTGTNNTYECILVPQTVKYSVVIDAKVNNSQKSYVYTPANAYEFKSNNSYTLTLTVKKADEPTAIEGIDVKGWDESIALGDGEAVEPYTVDAEGHYTVRTAEGLLAWAEAVESNNSINCTLAANIDMTEETWQGANISYSGTFDGNGHTITGLGECFITDNNGTVKNLTLVNPEILSSDFSAGAVAGTNYGIIENCHVVGGIVEGTGSHSGGIAVYNEQNGTIRACSTSTTVTLTYEGTAGGITGSNAGIVLACYATGNITGSADSKGAISGERTRGEHTACYWSGDTEKGVGSGSADGTTKVEGDVTWTAAMNAMNTALSGTGYQWELNPDDKTGKHPLIITTITNE